MAHPKHINAIDGSNRFDLLESALCFYLCYDQGSIVIITYFLSNITIFVITLSKAERGTSSSKWGVTTGLHNGSRLLRGFNHWNHYPTCTQIE